MNNISYLKRYRRIYLASPYSLYPDGLDAAYKEVCRIAGILMQEGIYVYCPIAHGHGITINGGPDAGNAAFWLDQDRTLQDDSDALVIAQMKNWDKSEGIKAETAQAIIMGQPIHYLEPTRMILVR